MNVSLMFIFSGNFQFETGLLSCPQTWNIEQEKDREKEKVGSRPAKLNEIKGDRDLKREFKKKETFFC